MKVLISAFACDPSGGSELFVGWSAVRCLAQDHDLWVLTSERSKPNLERATAEGLVPKNIRFIYAGKIKPWHPNRLLARVQGWGEYRQFTALTFPIAQELHRSIQFDVAHHVTYATWRVGSPLWQLEIPFVFGPIGGYGQFPLRFLPILSPAAAGLEIARMFSNLVSRLSYSTVQCLRNSSHIFAADAETFSLAKKLRGAEKGISCLSQAFYSEAKIEAFGRYAKFKNLNEPLRLFAGGNLIGSKGISLALHGLAKAKAQGVDFRYRLSGHGPERPHLQKLARKLELQNEIVFAEALAGDAYQKELGATHILLLPSLRESAGLTMMEAMLAGCVPVVADCGGPALAVTEDCGYKIPISDSAEFIDELAQTIVMLDRNREIILSKGAVAAGRISAGFSEENYRRSVNDVYISLKRNGP